MGHLTGRLAPFLALALTAPALAVDSWTARFFDDQNTANVGVDAGLDAASAPTLEVLATIPTSTSVNHTPVVTDGLLFVGDWNGNLYVVDLAFDDVIVKLETESNDGTGGSLGTYQGIQSTPVIADVTVPDGDGTREERRLYVPVNRQPETLWCLSIDAILAARDAANQNGTPLSEAPGTSFTCTGATWPISLVAPTGSNGKYNGSMLFAADRTVTGGAGPRDLLYAPSTGLDCADGVLYAVDAYTGEKYWSFDPVPGDKGGVIWTKPAVSRDGSRIFVTTGDCVQQPQVGAMAESLVAIDAETGEKIWHHQRRLVDAADIDIGNSPSVVDSDACHVVVSPDKDGCLYGYRQEIDIPEVGEPGWDPLRPGQQRILWRTCFVPGSLNGGFNASGLAIHDGILFAQSNPPVRMPGDTASTFAVDACTGDLLWSSSAIGKGRGEGAIASGLYFQPAGNLLHVATADSAGTLLASVVLPGSATGGGGGPAIVNGRIYVPLGSGGVAVVGPNPGGQVVSPPQPASLHVFNGPYPHPVVMAPGQVYTNVDPNDPYPPVIDDD